MEINLTEVNPSDQITIRTQFSAYNFRITDPLSGRGIPSGGRLGDEPHDARSGWSHLMWFGTFGLFCLFIDKFPNPAYLLPQFSSEFPRKSSE